MNSTKKASARPCSRTRDCISRLERRGSPPRASEMMPSASVPSTASMAITAMIGRMYSMPRIYSSDRDIYSGPARTPPVDAHRGWGEDVGLSSGARPMEAKLDRTAEDIGNICKLEHVNVTIPDQGPATLFYVAGLGLTRDPYVMVSTNN